MIDIEKFLISLRNNKNSDGLRHPIYLADNLQEEIKILQDAIQHSRREWVGLTEEEIIQIASTPDGSQATTKGYVIPFTRAIEAKLREKNHAG